jgi:hypothetical protein
MKTARHKCQRSPLTGSSQEIPPAEFKEPAFFLRDLQAMLLFRETKNLALPSKQVNRAATSATSGHAAQPSDRTHARTQERLQPSCIVRKLMGQYLEKLYWPDDPDPAIVLKVQKRCITAYDVVSIGSNCCLQEFVIIGVATN